MPTWEGRHAVADFLGRAAPRWRPAVAVVAAAMLALTVGAAARQPASAADSYTVTGTIEVGTGPDGVAVDPTSHTAFVTDIDDDALSVIDEATKSVTATIIVGGGPLTVAADPTTRLAYVTNGGNGTVSVINEATSTVTVIIAVGHGPDGVAMDPTSHLAYVANGGDGTVSAINETTGTVTATIPVGADPDGVAVDPTSHTAYVANGGDGTVSAINETTGTVTATIPVGADPDGVAVDPTSHTAYVANSGASTVSVINETTGTVTATIPVGSHPAGVAVDPTSTTAYVANLGGTVSVIDEATRKVTATVPVGADPDGVAVDPTSHTAYVANGGASSVSVISVTRPTPVSTVTKVTPSRNPSTFGQSVTFTATVGPADGGTITFSRGSKALCSAVSLAHVSGSSYHARCATKTLPVGRTTITAVYRGDASYAASTGRLTQTVAKAPTTLTERINSGPHSRFTLTAKLTASGRPLGGQPVAFSTGKTHLCSSHTNNVGVASCVFTKPKSRPAGQDNEILRASYPGNASYRPSSATVRLQRLQGMSHRADPAPRKAL
jgi:YVTN family beta-propeller protein